MKTKSLIISLLLLFVTGLELMATTLQVKSD